MMESTALILNLALWDMSESEQQLTLLLGISLATTTDFFLQMIHGVLWRLMLL